MEILARTVSWLSAPNCFHEVFARSFRGIGNTPWHKPPLGIVLMIGFVTYRFGNRRPKRASAKKWRKHWWRTWLLLHTWCSVSWRTTTKKMLTKKYDFSSGFFSVDFFPLSITLHVPFSYFLLPTTYQHAYTYVVWRANELFVICHVSTPYNMCDAR